MSATATILDVESVQAWPVDKASRTSMQVLIGPEQGAPTFVTRRFTIEPGGRIPCHRHPDIEHVQVMESGEMVLSLDGTEQSVGPGKALLIPAGVAHWYENRGDRPVRFLCIVPLTDSYDTEWLE